RGTESTCGVGHWSYPCRPLLCGIRTNRQLDGQRDVIPLARISTMYSANRPQTYFEVVSEGIPLPPTKNTGIMLSSAPLDLLKICQCKAGATPRAASAAKEN